MLPALLGLHAVVAVLALLTGRRLGPRVFLLIAAAPAATTVWLASRASAVIDGGSVTTRASWVGDLGLTLDLRLDGFGLLMALLVAGIGTLVFAYSRWYFGARDDLGRLAATLVVFAGAMLGLVVADNLILLYVCWELTSVTSYLLIGFDDRKGSARAAALQALLVTGGGGLAMLGGFVLLGEAAGTYSLSAWLADPPSGATVTAGLLLVLLGAFTKSAQVPFHGWLPGAMAAPTPVSTYLHSATMVKAGIYLVARFAPAVAADHAFWRPLVLTVGAATMFLGGYRALRQYDLKLLLAFGTVSQLGFMMVLVGAGHPDLTFAGTAVILAHGLFKAALFMVVGIVDHQAHTRDLRVLTGLWRRMPVTFAAAAIAAASMAGLPPLFGFAAKEAALEGLIHDEAPLLVAAVVVASALTFAYGARFVWGAFADKQPLRLGEPVGADVARPVRAFVLPALLLAVLTVVVGLTPGSGASLARAAARALDPEVGSPNLYLWHGFTSALAMSVVTVVLGGALFVMRQRVARAQSRLHPPLDAQAAYEASVRALNRVADRVTGIVQNGSLPIYVGVILLTLLALPGSVLLTRTDLTTERLRFAESPLQAAVIGLVVAAAVGASLARRRFSAVLLLGAVGFAVAVLFVMQGAPDLALTQLLVETLALVIFVLVLRHLPDRFEPVPWRLGNALRLAIAGGVGAFVTLFGLVAATSREAAPISDEHVARALPEGGGRNIVNVIITDIRALDTLGEITVLVVVALGIAGLVLAGRGRTEEEPDAV
jgi:multicomponent Na+:H+ antiporter subunit A